MLNFKHIKKISLKV